MSRPSSIEFDRNLFEIPAKCGCDLHSSAACKIMGIPCPGKNIPPDPKTGKKVKGRCDCPHIIRPCQHVWTADDAFYSASWAKKFLDRDDYRGLIAKWGALLAAFYTEEYREPPNLSDFLMRWHTLVQIAGFTPVQCYNRVEDYEQEYQQVLPRLRARDTRAEAQRLHNLIPVAWPMKNLHKKARIDRMARRWGQSETPMMSLWHDGDARIGQQGFDGLAILIPEKGERGWTGNGQHDEGILIERDTLERQDADDDAVDDPDADAFLQWKLRKLHDPDFAQPFKDYLKNPEPKENNLKENPCRHALQQGRRQRRCANA